MNIIHLIMKWLKSDTLFYIGRNDVLPSPLNASDELEALVALEKRSTIRR